MKKDVFTKMKKACECFATASGPRLFFKAPEGVDTPHTNPEVQMAEVVLVQLACDACGEPWVKA